ncbi:MAG: tetraacyldisaccharide 4'-kinase [Methylococcaceae bacterium]|nr:tetraacyldisaccharide 4'-kinase [Methylococcaceae bacterium]
MTQSWQNWLEKQWYQQAKPPFTLRLLTVIFKTAVYWRRFCYQIGIVKQVKLSVPVIIVGNLTVGGTGKSPLVIYLAELLSNAGYKPGIISRGYGGKSLQRPQRVFADSNPAQVGDEAVMIATHSNCPVAVDSVRSKAAQLLLTTTDCDVIISDDGLQHYALQRDIEIAVIDGERRFGNGFCLPAGPLREPVERLHSFNFVVVNGAPLQQTEFAMRVKANIALNLQSGEKKPLADFCDIPVHALAAIGNPQRFFNLLTALGINHTRSVFPDHYQFQAADLQFDDNLPLLMTEKDAVKCRAFATQQHWYVPISVELNSQFTQQLLTLLQEKRHGSQFT